MKKIHLLYAVFALLATGFSSCEDLLTEEPNSKYDRNRYFDSEDKAEMAVMGIYSSLSDFNHYGWYEMASPASDEPIIRLVRSLTIRFTILHIIS